MLDECEFCYQPMDGHKTRWLCPRCGMKNHCCAGSPLPVKGGGAPVPGLKAPPRGGKTQP